MYSPIRAIETPSTSPKAKSDSLQKLDIDITKIMTAGSVNNKLNEDREVNKKQIELIMLYAL